MRRALARAPCLARPLSTASAKAPLPPQTQVTTLPNGVRVATDPAPGHFIAAGVYFDAGTRYEGERTRGATHMMDRLAFKSTTNRTAEQMTTEREALGQQFFSTSSRDIVIYQASTYTHSLPAVMSILSDTTLNPLITGEEIDHDREAMAWEIAEIKTKPELILPEILHSVAYKDNTLGLSTLCPEERIATMTPELLREYRSMWFRPERTVVAAAGVEHEAFVDLVRGQFGDMKISSSASTSSSPSTSSSSSTKSSTLSKPFSTSAATSASSLDATLSSTPPADSFELLSKAKARYTGGEAYLEKELDRETPFTHIYVGFEGLPLFDEDIYVLAVLNQLLGGGSSFSAGGPGKGMYSRLYTHMLNQHHSIDYCQSFFHLYADSGLFGIAMAVNPDFATDATWHLAHQLDSITRPMRGGVGQGDLERARNQLKSTFAMQLESRAVQVEDLGRQILVQNQKHSLEEMFRRTDAVTLQDLYRVAGRILRPSKSALVGDRKRTGKPTIVVQGDLSQVPDVMHVLRTKGLSGEA